MKSLCLHSGMRVCVVFKNEKLLRSEFYKTKSSTIHANLGCIVEQTTEI